MRVGGGRQEGIRGEGRRGIKCRECRNNVLVYRSAEPMDGNSYTSTPDFALLCSVCSEITSPGDIFVLVL